MTTPMTANSSARFKRVMRWDRRNRIYRLARFIWERGTVGDGEGYSAMLSASLTPYLFSFKRGHFEEWFLIILGVRLHYRRAYGGRFV